MALGADPRVAGRNGRASSQAAALPTRTYRAWRAMNVADSRLSIDDDEVYWRENLMPVGRGQQCVPLYAGDPGEPLTIVPDVQVKETWGGQLTFPGETQPRPIFIAIFTDGSAYQRDYTNDFAVDRQIAPPGTFKTTDPTGITPWQDGPLLFLDAQAGYCKWDGVTFTVIDAALKGGAIAVFEGHAWLVLAARVIHVTAPNTYDDFDPAHGALIYRITDEAFEGAIYQLLSTVEQLWVIGATAVDAIGNVQTTGGVTTFATTNAVRSLGSTFANSVIAYYRLLVFSTGYSIHALLGVTPQKLSAKLDRLFARLGKMTPYGPRAGVVTLNDQTALAMLYQYDDPILGRPRPLLVCFTEGQWFVCGTPDLNGHQILDMATLTIHGIPELYGIDQANRVYRLFARAGDPMGGMSTMMSKLYEFGTPTASQFDIRVGLDLSGPEDVETATVTATLVSERKERTATTTVAMFQTANAPLGIRYGLARRNAEMAGERVGITISLLASQRLCIESLHFASDTTEPFVNGG